MTIHMLNELEKLKNKLLGLGILVEEQLSNAVDAIERQDLRLAQEVIRHDVDVDRKEIDIEEDCLKILALHQPVAIDLRFMVGVLKINNDLERIGDLAASIAKKVPFDADDDTRDVNLPNFEFKVMTNKCINLFRASLDSMINQDIDQARQVCIDDDDIDTMNQRARAIVIESLKQDSSQVEVLLKKLSVARDLERIADHATNIAEDVIYMVSGEIVRHPHSKKNFN